MFCPNCGNQVEQGSKHCPACGYGLSSAWSSSVSRHTGSSLSSSFYTKDGFTAAAHLSEVVTSALREFGPDVLKTPRRMVSYAMDFIPEEDRVGTTFIMHCDEEFLGIFDRALAQRTPDSLIDATMKAKHLLTDDRSIVDRMATLIAESVTEGVADYAGIAVTFPGHTETSNVVACPYCGVSNPEANEYCQECGRPLRQVPPHPATIACPHCGVANPETNEYCKECGRPLRQVPDVPPSMSPCPHCGALNPLDSDFCANCGGKLKGRTTGGDTKPWLVVAVAALAGVLVVLLICNGTGMGKKPVDDLVEDPTEDAIEEEHAAPVFTEAEATSSFDQPGENSPKHTPELVLDGDLTTAWEEDKGGRASDPGIGESITLKADTEQYVSGVRIINGYAKTWYNYYWDTRPKQITITLSDNWSTTYTLIDRGITKEYPVDGLPTYVVGEAAPLEAPEGLDIYRPTEEKVSKDEVEDPDFPLWQEVDFDEVHKTTFIRITIDSVYEEGAMKNPSDRDNDWYDTTITEIRAY